VGLSVLQLHHDWVLEQTDSARIIMALKWASVDPDELIKVPRTPCFKTLFIHVYASRQRLQGLTVPFPL
jgi:hypothetical protein